MLITTLRIKKYVFGKQRPTLKSALHRTAFFRNTRTAFLYVSFYAEDLGSQSSEFFFKVQGAAGYFPSYTAHRYKHRDVCNCFQVWNWQ
jgi:hypothetical protein